MGVHGRVHAFKWFYRFLNPYPNLLCPSCPAQLLFSLHFTSPPLPFPLHPSSSLSSLPFFPPFLLPLIISNAWPKMLLIFVNFYFLFMFFAFVCVWACLHTCMHVQMGVVFIYVSTDTCVGQMQGLKPLLLGSQPKVGAWNSTRVHIRAYSLSVFNHLFRTQKSLMFIFVTLVIVQDPSSFLVSMYLQIIF